MTHLEIEDEIYERITAMTVGLSDAAHAIDWVADWGAIDGNAVVSFLDNIGGQLVPIGEAVLRLVAERNAHRSHAIANANAQETLNDGLDVLRHLKRNLEALVESERKRDTKHSKSVAVQLQSLVDSIDVYDVVHPIQT